MASRGWKGLMAQVPFINPAKRMDGTQKSNNNNNNNNNNSIQRCLLTAKVHIINPAQNTNGTQKH